MNHLLIKRFRINILLSLILVFMLMLFLNLSKTISIVSIIEEEVPLGSVVEVYLPIEIYENSSNENKVNSITLNRFLAQNSGKKVIFPIEVDFYLDGPIQLINSNNLIIDFRKSKLIYPEGVVEWPSRYSNGVYIGNSLFSIVNSSSIQISNLVLDGNKLNDDEIIGDYSSSTGIWLSDSHNIDFKDLSISSFSHTGIVIYPNTKAIVFDGLILKDNYGAPNSSDVFVSNSQYDDCTFYRIESTRTSLRGNQVFYINGYNTNIEDLTAYNCGTVLDYRKGKHIASDIKIDSSISTVGIISTSYRDYPEITIEGLFATNIYGDEKTKAGLGIWNCKSVNFYNINISLSQESKNAWWGIVIRQFADDSVLDNVYINNIRVDNSTISAIRYENLNGSTRIEDIQLMPRSNFSFRAENCKAPQFVSANGQESLKSRYDPSGSIIFNQLK